jgi:Domain of unknown function (DUF4251)
MEYSCVIHLSCSMKTFRNIFLLVLIVGAGLNAASAQTAAKDKKAAKAAELKKNIEAKTYTFVADQMLPQGGGTHLLTSEYDLRIIGDSVISFLPYFGRAYFGVGYNDDNGIKFTSTKFDYSLKEQKKGGWQIKITPHDAKNIQYLILNVSTSGYASLSVTSVNRDYISFYGYVKEKDKDPLPAIVDPIQ